MGKKIPSKKHNKLKSVDPFNRGSNSLALKGKDDSKNRKPKNLMQEAPGSLRRLFGDQDDDDRAPKKKKKKTNRMTVHTQDHRKGSASSVSQNSYETDDQFLKRVSQMANRARERATISSKFDVRFNEDGTREVDVADASTLPTRRKRRLEAYKEKLKARQLKKQGGVAAAGSAAAEPGNRGGGEGQNHTDGRKQKNSSSNNNKGAISKQVRHEDEDDDEDRDEHEDKYKDRAKEFPGRETVRFGEIVHAPPEITARLRGAPAKDPKKIARSLLCHPDNMIKKKKQQAAAACGDDDYSSRMQSSDDDSEENHQSSAGSSQKKKKKKSSAKDANDGIKEIERIRWKNLEASKRAELEAERQRVIEAYRRMRNK